MQSTSDAKSAQPALARECRLFAAYLIGEAPPEEIIVRYTQANQALLPDSSDSGRVVDFVSRHPWALPFLDAACGLLRGDDLLRKKLLVLLAILEATPQFAAEFLPPPGRGLVPLAVEVGWNGAIAALKCAVGILLWPLVN